MSDRLSLRNHFLIAMPMLQDPNFFHGVTYICEHTKEGAMGIVINHPLNISLTAIFDQLSIADYTPDSAKQIIYQGGPVQVDRGFVIHNGDKTWDSTMNITNDISLSSSQDILRAIAKGEGPDQQMIALGYAGWAAGQLEQELAENAWLNTPAKKEVLFDTPYEKRWEAAAASAGIDINSLSSDVGHA